MKVILKSDKEKIREDILKSVSLNEPIEIESYTVIRDFLQEINEVLLIFLQACNKDKLMSCLAYSSSELLGNADKANIKRLFCKENNLDIHNSIDYEAAMIDFKVEISSNLEHFRQLQEENHLYIKYELSCIDGVISLKVKNKAVLTEEEKARINRKIERAKLYHSMQEAFMTIDQTEGSGLGIIIIILMLKQMKLGAECLRIESVGEETISSIEIPVA